MAKKKSAKPEAVADSATSTLKATKTLAIDNSTVTSADRGFSCEHIGLVAGEIWHLLSSNGGQTLTSVKKTIKAPADLVTAAIGWLAREGKIEIAKRGRVVKLTLR